jgi:glycosyltransferase involved in cell wall biosynthesis
MRTVSIEQNREVCRAILSGRYDVVWIHGYSSLNSVAAMLAARLRRIPVLLREEATLLDRRPLPTRAAKAVALPLLLRNAYGLYIGKENERFFQRYGVPESKLFFAPYSVDNAFFQQQAMTLRQQRHSLRLSFGLPPDVPVILFCGKLIPKKDPLSLLKAFAALRRRHECALFFAGDGPLRAEIEAFVGGNNVPDVRISGFLNQSEVSKAYAAADVLVLPSIERETWGLVVNEAMNFELPIIVSDKVGCASDLVRPDENGYIVRASDPDHLMHPLRLLILDSARRREFGRRSRLVIDSWKLEDTAAGIATAVRAVMKVQQPLAVRP